MLEERKKTCCVLNILAITLHSLLVMNRILGWREASAPIVVEKYINGTHTFVASDLLAVFVSPQLHPTIGLARHPHCTQVHREMSIKGPPLMTNQCDDPLARINRSLAKISSSSLLAGSLFPACSDPRERRRLIRQLMLFNCQRTGGVLQSTRDDGGGEK